MGCQKLFQTIHKKGLPLVSGKLQDLKDDGVVRLEIDLFAMYFSILRKHAGSREYCSQDGFYDCDQSMRSAAAEVHRQIQLDFEPLLADESPVQISIHIDGEPSAAKGVEHAKRHKVREDTCRELASEIRRLETKQGGFIPKKLTDRIEAQLRHVCQLSQQDRRTLNESFQSLGFSSHVCHAEADPCIATACHESSGSTDKVAVVTKDSDLLVYCDVEMVLRPNPQDAGFVVYRKSEVLAALGLHRKEFLTLYGMTLRNDYAPNVKTIGPVTSLELVVQIQSETETTTKKRKRSQGPDLSKDLDGGLALRPLLRQFCLKAGTRIKRIVRPGRFESALRTFGFRSQLRVDDALDAEEWMPIYEEPIPEPEYPFMEEEDQPQAVTTFMSEEQLAMEARRFLQEFSSIMLRRATYNPPSPDV